MSQVPTRQTRCVSEECKTAGGKARPITPRTSRSTVQLDAVTGQVELGYSLQRYKTARDEDDFEWGRERFLDEARSLGRIQASTGCENS